MMPQSTCEGSIEMSSSADHDHERHPERDGAAQVDVLAAVEPHVRDHRHAGVDGERGGEPLHLAALHLVVVQHPDHARHEGRRGRAGEPGEPALVGRRTAAC